MRSLKKSAAIRSAPCNISIAIIYLKKVPFFFVLLEVLFEETVEDPFSRHRFCKAGILTEMLKFLICLRGEIDIEFF